MNALASAIVINFGIIAVLAAVFAFGFFIGKDYGYDKAEDEFDAKAAARTKT